MREREGGGRDVYLLYEQISGRFGSDECMIQHMVASRRHSVAAKMNMMYMVFYTIFLVTGLSDADKTQTSLYMRVL